MARDTGNQIDVIYTWPINYLVPPREMENISRGPTQRVHISTRDETGLVCLPWSALSAGAYTATLQTMKGGGRAPPPSPAWANFTLMMEFTPESSRCHSVYSVVPPSGILSLSAQRRRCRKAQWQDYRVQEYRVSSFKCNVLRESLSVDSQNIPCATLVKRRGSWVISVYLWFHPLPILSPSSLHALA
jgi:hypothetical protein